MDLSADETQEVIIRSGASSDRELDVNEDGSLNVRVSPIPDTTLTKTFTSVYEGTVGTSETDSILITNPIGSGKTLYFSGLSITPVTNGRTFTPRLYINPTITTNGTSLTKSSVVLQGTPPVSVSAVYSLPTISDRGTKIKVFSSGQFQDTSNLIQTNTLCLAEGYSVLMTNLASSVNSSYAVNITWSEL